MSETLRVLVVDDDRRMAKTLTDIFRVKGYRAEAAHSGAEALEKIKAAESEAGGQFDCVLTDIKMPEMNGVELHRAVKTLASALPVVFMTAYAADETIKEGLAEGALAALAKPLDIELLLSFFSALSRESMIVIVDDDANFSKTLHDILEARGFNIIKIADPAEVMQLLLPDGQVVLLDLKLNGLSGLEVLREIKERHPQQPVVLVTGHRREMAGAIETGLELSAYTCLYKPLEIEKLLEVLAEIRRGELAGVLDRSVGKPIKKG